MLDRRGVAAERGELGPLLGGGLERAVARGLQRKEWKLPSHLGVDEKAFGRGQDYETVVCDLEERVVEFVGDGRRQESLEEYFWPFNEEERAGVGSICLDMWKPYIATLQAVIPGAEDKMVFDKFHVVNDRPNGATCDRPNGARARSA
jgi:transposase